jgi:hypothetical protein
MLKLKIGEKSIKRILFPVVFLSVLLLISCSDTDNITWRGTWISEKDYDERGNFIFDLKIEHEELTGTITIPGMGISNLQVEGDISQDTILSWITHIEFSDVDNRVNFKAINKYYEIDSDTKIENGVYTDDATGDLGVWYCSDGSRKDFASISSFSVDTTILNARGLCFDGNHLWMSNRNLDSGEPSMIYKVDASSGTIIDSFDVTNSVPYPTGLAWDGTSIWCMAPGRLYKLDTLCSVQSSFSVTGNEGGGITYASGYIWYCVPFMDELQKIDPSNGNVVNTYYFPTALPTGFAFDGTSLWLTTEGDYLDINDWPAIYKIDQSGNIIDKYNSPCYSSGALAYDGSFLYCVGIDNHAWKNRIYKLEF